MKTANTAWRPVRRNELRTERVHDTYKLARKPEEPARCPECGVMFHAGRWSREAGGVAAGKEVHEVVCPACHRIRDRFPAGYVHLAGPFVAQHRDEILQLVRHRERHEMDEHPLERIMEIEEKADEVAITTTDIHLAREIGDALHAAYKGDLEFHYNDAENLLRVRWTR